MISVMCVVDKNASDLFLDIDSPYTKKRPKKFLINLYELSAKITRIPLDDCRVGFEKSVGSIDLST
jgi:hypothetical protein